MLILQLATENIPPDLMNMVFLIIVILIIILILVAFFLALLLVWLRRQGRMHFPIKPKLIKRKQRNLLQTKQTGSETNVNTANENKGEVLEKTPTAKPVAAVRPIKISSHRPHHSTDSQASEQKTVDDNDAETQEEKSSTTLKKIAKPLHHESKSDDDKIKNTDAKSDKESKK